MPKSQGVSLRPDDMREGTGLLDDCNVTFESVRFVMWDYNGKIPQASPAIEAKLVNDDGEEHVQYWSMGSAKDWMPSDDGTSLVPVGTAIAINNNANGALLIQSIVEAGFPDEEVGDDISVFDGMEAHVVRQPAPKRTGLSGTKREDGREPTILLVDEVVTLPWDQKKSKKSSGSKSKGTASKSKGTTSKSKSKTSTKKSSGDDELEAKVTAVILGALDEADELTKQELPKVIFQAMKDDDDRNEAVKLSHNDEFLSNGPWNYEDGVVSM